MDETLKQKLLSSLPEDDNLFIDNFSIFPESHFVEVRGRFHGQTFKIEWNYHQSDEVKIEMREVFGTMKTSSARLASLKRCFTKSM